MSDKGDEKIRERQREGIALAKRESKYKGCALTGEHEDFRGSWPIFAASVPLFMETAKASERSQWPPRRPNQARSLPINRSERTIEIFHAVAVLIGQNGEACFYLTAGRKRCRGPMPLRRSRRTASRGSRLTTMFRTVPKFHPEGLFKYAGPPTNPFNPSDQFA